MEHKNSLKGRIINHQIEKQGTLIKAAQETGAITTIEEHDLNGGLGPSVARVILGREAGEEVMADLLYGILNPRIRLGE